MRSLGPIGYQEFIPVDAAHGKASRYPRLEVTADGEPVFTKADGTTAKPLTDSAAPANIVIAASAGGANVCEVTFTVKDAAGSTIAGVYVFDVYLSDAATGAGLTGTSASGTVQAKSASGADFAALTAKKALRVQTLATGIYTLEITDIAKTAFYPCAILPTTGRAIVGTVLATGDYGS